MRRAPDRPHEALVFFRNERVDLRIDRIDLRAELITEQVDRAIKAVETPVESVDWPGIGGEWREAVGRNDYATSAGSVAAKDLEAVMNWSKNAASSETPSDDKTFATN